ncbi:PKD domain-containing protein [Natronolimnohabitans sp. A-GB9]|uniref:PKD domain-containing protein n=1 Tax=Natronolimnohabitans sp. A-GB9 TaxID=3069757 RepID=UPI0027AFC708|nr:PKD domain-containing protein [Natronolimnohabitans sp. A-GB9]MDQ2052808.1 PKD domain-containing protein [Natronolimnohabitans sp. A-GB9]
MAYSKRPGTVIFLVTIMLLAPIAGVMGTAGASGDDEVPVSIEGEMIVADEVDVEVWNRAPLALMANSTDASESVDIPPVAIETPEADTDLGTTEIGVYETEEPISFTLADHSDVNRSVIEDDLDDLQVLRGQLTENVDGGDFDESAVPTTEEEMLAELTQENIDNLNDNVTFTLEDEPDIDDEGTLEYTNETDESGMYTYIVTSGLDSDAVDDGNITPAEMAGMSVLGVEQVAVHENPSSVAVTNSPEPGDDVTVDVDADALEGNVTHAVALYDSDTLTSEEIVLNATGELDTDPSAADVSLEHSINEINGSHEIGDVDLPEHISIAKIADSLGNETALDETDVAPDGEGVTLEASTNATIDDPDTEIVLGTTDNWDGDYQLVHIAAGTASDEFQVGTEEVTIEEETGTGPSPSPSPPGDPDPEKPEAVISIDPDPAEVGEEITFSGAESTADRPIVDYEWEIAGETYHGETVTTSFDKPGAYDVELVVSTAFADSEPETTKVTVTGPPDDTPVDDDTPADDEPVDDEPVDDEPADDDADDSIPGFGVAATLVAVLSLAVLALRRQH